MAGTKVDCFAVMEIKRADSTNVEFTLTGTYESEKVGNNEVSRINFNFHKKLEEAPNLGDLQGAIGNLAGAFFPAGSTVPATIENGVKDICKIPALNVLLTTELLVTDLKYLSKYKEIDPKTNQETGKELNQLGFGLAFKPHGMKLGNITVKAFGFRYDKDLDI